MGIFPIMKKGTVTVPYSPRLTVYPLDINYENTNDLIFISAEIYPGQSGSPIVNEDNKVIGIIFASIMSEAGMGISVREIYQFLYE